MYSVRSYDEVLIRSKNLVKSLQESSTADDFCRAVVNVALKKDGALAAFVATKSQDGTVQVLGSYGYPDQVFGNKNRVSIFEHRGATDSIRTNTILFFDSALEYGFRYPRLNPMEHLGEGLILIPVVAGSKAIGCVGVSFVDRLNFEQRQSQFWDIFPLICGAFLQFSDFREAKPSEYLRSLDF